MNDKSGAETRLAQPLISVIIPTFNNARFLPKALASVLSQDYLCCELIVVDDGSTDDTTAVLTPFDDVQVIWQANAGSAAARNTGLAQARGEVVVFLDADDYFLPGRLAAHMEFLAAHPMVGVAHSGWQKVSATGQFIRDVLPWQDAPRLDLADWLCWKPVFLGAMTFRREWLERVGGLNPALRQAHDVDLAWRLALAGCTFGWVKRPLVAYRQHETNTTRDGRTQAESLDALLDDFFTRPDLPETARELEPQTRIQTWLWSAYHLFKTGQLAEMKPYIQKATTIPPPETPESQLSTWARQFWLWGLADELSSDVMLGLLPALGQAMPNVGTNWLAGSSSSPDLPFVSVIIPTFNNGRYLTDAVTSVLAQSGVACEIIVVDDGSTDGTAAVLAQFAGRVQVVSQANHGVCHARNQGLRLARGEFVVFLDADDLFLPEKLALQAEILVNDARLGAVHSGWQLMDERARPLRLVEPWHEAPNLDLVDWLMWKPAYLGGLIFRREWLERTGGFDESLRQAEDVDFLWRLSLAGCRFGWLKAVTVCYRQHGKNTVANGRAQAENLCRALDNFFGRPDLPAAARRLENQVRYYTLMWLVWQLFRTGYQAEIPGYLRRSLVHTDFPPQMAVSHWLGQLTRFAVQDGAAAAELRRLWPCFQEAAELDDGRWAEIVPGLDWWLDVWRPYLDGRITEAEANLAGYAHLSPRQLVQMAQSGVLASPQLADTAVIGQFWAAAQRLGLASGADAAEVTPLYLTTMAHALFQHRWRLAAAAAAAAMRHSWRRPGLAAWGRFVAAGWRYYGGRPS